MLSRLCGALAALALMAAMLTALLALSSALTGCDTSDPFAVCCRVCLNGKACGDECIAEDAPCELGPGCACNG